MRLRMMMMMIRWVIESANASSCSDDGCKGGVLMVSHFSAEALIRDDVRDLTV